MSQRHILVANVHFAPFTYGGATVVAEEVARALVRRGGYRITAVSSCERPELAPYSLIRTERDGISNILINLPPHRGDVERYDNPQVTERMVEIIAAVEPDLVHAHCLQELGTGVLQAAAMAGVPAILSVHDFWWICERQFMVRVDERYCGQDPVRAEVCKSCVNSLTATRLRQRHLGHVAEGVALVTYPSRFAMDLSERSGFAPGKGALWENGVRLPGPDFAARQATRRMRESRTTFGFLGGPSQIKGWPLIRKAFSLLDRSDFRVLLAEGSLDGGWWEGIDLQTLPGEWAVHPRFDQSGMDAFYAEIDVLLFPSQWKETFGLVIREALARGVAVIQSDSGGTVEHGAVPRDRLLPIGQGADALRAQIEEAIEAGPTCHDAVPVRSFGGQAEAFDRIAGEILDQKTKSFSSRSSRSTSSSLMELPVPVSMMVSAPD
ncbi:MAG: glycosyltransferase [Sulfitobacter sp.]|nr:glycosyltransferase [Sulfitobacter sp.]